MLIFSASSTFAAQQRNSYDVIVAGGGIGGIASAIQSARMGASVLVIESSSWIGGQATAAGVSTMDDLSRLKSGMYLEFITRIKNYYDARGKSMGTCYWDSRSVAFEPHIGQEALIGMINEIRRKTPLDFLMNSNVISVQKDKNKITGVTVKTPRDERKFSCKILIDATEYGDILPLSGTQYRAGNSISKFLNPDSMIQDITWVAIIHKYTGGIPDHLKPKNPLPGYELAKRNYESYVTKNGANFKNTYPVATPVNFISHNAYRGLPDSSNPWGYDADRPNWSYISKTGVNWGNDYPGTYGWNGKRGLPVSYLENKNLREQIERDALIKTLHFIYYIQNELGEEWSVAEDEYNNRTLPKAAQNLPSEWQNIVRKMPPIPYVRESRRIIGKHTLTSHELLQNSLSYRDGQTSHEFYDAIAIGGYPLDLHGAATDSDMEWDLDEKANSAILNRPRGPFQVPMRILIPDGTDGLIAAEKNLSMSRLAAGALRLQPISMMTGQAAGALAAISVKNDLYPRNVPAIKVQWELLNSGVVLSLCNYSDVPPNHSLNKSIQVSNMYGLIDPIEYPHAPSYNISDLDDPVLAMAIIRGHDKGIFGVNELVTRREALSMLTRAREQFKVFSSETILEGKLDDFISRGDFVKAIYDTFPELKNKKQIIKFPFKTSKHRSSEYVEVLSKLGILNIYAIESEFHYGRPVTKGEAADILVRAALANS